MNESLARSLYSYLLQQQRLPIPGLGMVVIDRIPARKDVAERKLIPPTYQFRFDQYFDSPDSDFFSFLAKEQGIPEHEVIQKYNQWSFDLRNTLQVDQPMPLGSYAHFIKKSSGDLVFETERPINPFFTKVAAEKVVSRSGDQQGELRVSESMGSGEDSIGLEAPETVKEKASWIWYALIFFASCAIYLFLHFHKLGWHFTSTGLQYLP